MLYVGLDLSRKRLDWQALDRRGAGRGSVRCRRIVTGCRTRPAVGRSAGVGGDRVDDRRPLRARSARAGRLGCQDRRCGQGARDRAVGLQDRPDRLLGAGRARPAASWSRRSGCPTRRVRAERERARFRLYLVKHRSSLKNRIHAILFQHGIPNASSDLFGAGGRRLLERLALPEPWASTVQAIARSDRHARRTDRRLRQQSCAGSAPTTATSRCCSPAPASAGRSPSRSPPRSARSTASQAHANSSATPASAPASTNPANATGAARCAKTDPTTCAGHSSKPPTPRSAGTHPTESSPTGCAAATAAPAATKSPRSRPAAASPRRSGTCSPTTTPSLRQAPLRPWPPDGPKPNCATGATPTN